MNFYIKKGATLPTLKLEMCMDGRSDFYLNSYLDGTQPIYVSALNLETKKYLFASKECYVTSEFSIFENKNLYFINYQFTKNETNEIGKFNLQFSIKSDNGVIVLPLSENLTVNIIDSFSVDNFNYDTNYVVDLPCCLPPNPTPTITPTPTLTPTQTNTPTTTPTQTVTPSITPTITPSPTDTTIFLTLDVLYNPGSISIDYQLTSSRIVTENVTLTFTNTLGVITGSPINVFTGVTINSGLSTGVTSILIDSDFNNLDRTSIFTDVSVTPSGGTFTYPINENSIFATPTPTPSITTTNTSTPTPTPTSAAPSTVPFSYNFNDQTSSGLNTFQIFLNGNQFVNKSSSAIDSFNFNVGDVVGLILTYNSGAQASISLEESGSVIYSDSNSKPPNTFTSPNITLISGKTYQVLATITLR